MNKNISKKILITTLLMLLFSCGEISSLPPIASSNISSEKRLEININNLKSKKEMGDSYGLGGTYFGINLNQKTKEWYEQADYFSNFIEGKSLKEINSLTFLNKYNYEDSTADKYVFIEGCTISQSSFITSLNKSINIKPITQINNGSYTLSVGSSVNIDNLNSCISLSIASYITNNANIICGLNVDVIEAKFAIK